MQKKQYSVLDDQLRKEKIELLPQFKSNFVTFVNSETTLPVHEKSQEKLSKIFELNGGTVLETGATTQKPKGKRVAVLFSGGPASGGHNVVSGLYDLLGKENTLLGIKAGPKGLLEGDLFELTDEDIDSVRNLGGFDLLGSDRTKIKTAAQFEAVTQTVKTHKLDGLVVVGGDDSNTNAAFLAESLNSVGCTVVGVPKTIDGDLQVPDLLPISFGFDTATKIYAELVGNILQDTPSSRKYWHFVKLMGRSASHVTLEVALQTQPPLTLISEEIKAKNWTMSNVVDLIAEAVVKRHELGLNYGVVVIPEGLIEFVSDFEKDMKSWPEEIQAQLAMDRDAHGNLQVSQIATETLLMTLVADKLKKDFPKVPFKANGHFFGYEGRCGAPSVFDANFTYHLGCVAAALVLSEKTGYMASLKDLGGDYTPVAIPLNALIQPEDRDGKEVLVIEKALVKLDSDAFVFYKKNRDTWLTADAFTSPGPRQYFGPTANQLPKILITKTGVLETKPA